MSADGRHIVASSRFAKMKPESVWNQSLHSREDAVAQSKHVSHDASLYFRTLNDLLKPNWSGKKSPSCYQPKMTEATLGVKIVAFTTFPAAHQQGVTSMFWLQF